MKNTSKIMHWTQNSRKIQLHGCSLAAAAIASLLQWKMGILGDVKVTTFLNAIPHFPQFFIYFRVFSFPFSMFSFMLFQTKIKRALHQAHMSATAKAKHGEELFSLVVIPK